ncbi:MAG: Dna2/Cas4 domain-containing protein [Candidatus Dadabacteria bacterium]|nr:MAG: Dna2/Cas4 domain-containing protein [Candidatus Dadabacteria bacterium]
MREEIRHAIETLLIHLVSVDTDLVLFVVLTIMAVIVIDAVTHFMSKQESRTGIDTSVPTISVDGSKAVAEKSYLSEIQGLAGTPDAIIVENGFVIPIERKPLAKKIRDRYVAQLLVYMRLIEEFEGKRPPYGYLILGPNCRKVKIYNTRKRQQWLQQMIDEMQAILQNGHSAKATPHPKKCKKCNVSDSCKYSYNHTTLKERNALKIVEA